MMNASADEDMELPKFCPMKICNLCQKYVFSPDLRYIQNLRIVTRCTNIFERGCCEDLVDEFLVTSSNDESTGSTTANLIFSFLFGIACCGAVFLIGKYIKDREAEKSNFNSMRRLSRARSITSEANGNQRRLSMLSAGRQFTDMTFPLAPEAGFYSNRRRSTLVTCAAHQKLGRKLSLQPMLE
ncbi:Oidioi.mRNA.OKI2018_I69.PAR.g9678.t1.cds [Oikopleura dioica]|uniref:Oidioi.mRNA.OKI2018_I69.PAR.g9678.t1.cds n=1 Tax=Oikopleura dioica TaxID=34765 RepID=A0ABN7RSK2_OIKDI|nr:Oidioi.mRNA.OKI2018_I69.PAR.g9678.t1.cds [Oikopleura dioica]